MASGTSISAERIAAFLATLERMAAGEADLLLPMSPAHDELDAIAFGINVLAGELRFATLSATEAERNRVVEIQAAKEIAEHANQAKTAFLRNASHEIRTPLTAIIAAAELMTFQGQDLASIQRLARQVLRNGEALRALVDGIVDIARIEEGRTDVRIQDFSLSQLADDVRICFAASAQAKGLNLEIPLHDDRVVYRTDYAKLRQIVFNVTANAIKFTEKGFVRIDFHVSNRRMSISVMDSGCGINAELRPHLFQPFSRGASRDIPGSGLGLALSKSLAKVLGGRLELLNSNPGEGSTFGLFIPVEPGTARAIENRAAEESRLEGVRILLAEDDVDIRTAYGMLLKSEGAVVTTASAGLQAFELGMNGVFDVLLLDLRMPDKDGMSIARELRRAGVKTPIVALTADAVRESKADCLAAGFSAFLSKPVDMSVLVSTIGALLNPPVNSPN